MNPHLNEKDYDSILLAEARSPGRVTLTGHTDSTTWDIKDGEGEDGAATTRKGKKPKPFTGTFELAYDPENDVDEFKQWEAFVPILRKYKDAAETIAADIYHPDLALLEITSVVVTDIGGIIHDGKGGGKVSVTFLPYAPPKPKSTAGPKGSKAIGGGGINVGDVLVEGADDANDPNAQAKAEVERLRKLAEETAPP